mmetsp:Transcript_14630/g.40650  ORF Transcript_14630/g.40650 Transcript_14630/m.40650 type:complete len:330 (-) Transcript_14630:725-1714(-)
MVFCLCQDPVGSRRGGTILFRLPIAKCLGLVICAVDRPIPLHGHDVKDGTKVIFVGSSWADLLPEKRPLEIAMRAPRPSVVAPVLFGPVATLLDELVVFTVGDHVLTGVKVGHADGAFTVLVVPPIRGKIRGLSQIHRIAFHRDHFVGWVIYSLDRVRRTRVVVGRWVNGRPIFRFLNQVSGCLAKQNRTRFEMDALVFVSHEKGPHGMGLVHRDRAIGIVQRRVVHNGILDDLVDLFAVFVNLTNRWPEHVVFVHVVPQHFIHSNLKNAFEVGVARFAQDPAHSKFVDVEACRVAVIKDLGMPQSVRWWSVEIFFAVQSSEQCLVQGP